MTGAAQGIGRETALALAEAGAKVAVATRNEEKLAALVQEITGKGGEAFAVKMDVADAEHIQAAFKTILEKFGKLDILVNNAAITRDGLAMRMKLDDWDAVLRTNLTGAHLCIQQALRGDDEGARGPHHQYRFGGGADGQRRASQLCGREGGPDWADESPGHRNCFAQYHRERRRSWLHRNADDGCSLRQGERRIEDAFPWGAWAADAMSPPPSCFWRATKPATSPATSST